MTKYKTSIIFSKKRFILLFAIIFLVSNLFLFTPINIYQGNIDEFAIPLTSILIFFFITALILILFLFIVGALLKNKICERYITILLVFGLLIWLQGNILVWKYGLLDGQSFDWSQNVWRGWIDGAVWLFLLSIAIFMYSKFFKITILASIILFSLQLVFSLYTSVQKPEIWRHKEGFSLPLKPPKNIFEFSSKQNVIHIILDGFQSDIFEEIIEENNAQYYKNFEGFTFFKESIGSFPTTYMSMPALLSGKVYQNNIPMKPFTTKVFKGKTIPNILYDNGYEVDLVLINGVEYIGIGKYSNKYILPVPYGVKKSRYILENSALMFDLVLFRLAPHFLKQYIYNNQSWLVQCIWNQNKNMFTFRYFSHKAFLEDLIENLTNTREMPVYKLIHLATTHMPVVVDKDCKFAGKVLPDSRDNLKIQARCSLEKIIELLEALKLNGIYDNSLIIINADHGAGKKVKMKKIESKSDEKFSNNIENIFAIVGSAIPLVAIKPPYRKGPLTVSNAQTMLTDLPATISSILNLNENFDGKSMFDISPDKIRERKFYYYRWLHEMWQADYFEHLNEFIIRGSVFNNSSWQKGLTLHSPKSSYRTNKINFGTNEADRFLRFGWSVNEKLKSTGDSFIWAVGEIASLYLSLPKNKTTLLTANIISFPFSEQQTVTIKIDDNKVGTWKLSAPQTWEFTEHSILIEPEINRPDVSIVEFSFTQQKKQDDKELRPLTVAFESITLSEINY